MDTSAVYEAVPTFYLTAYVPPRDNGWLRPMPIRKKPASAIERRLQEARLGAFVRPIQLEALGIRYEDLQFLIADGALERVGRGLYHLSGAEATENHTLAAVCARVPRSVVCLLSALRVHGIGSQVPRAVWLAIQHKARPPRLPDFQVRLLRFSGAAWTYGIADTDFEAVPARITNPARTVVDCFRFERLVSRAAAMDALRDALGRKLVTVDALYRTLDILPSRRLRNVLEATAP